MTNTIIIIFSAALTSALITLARFLFSKFFFSSGGGSKGSDQISRKPLFSIFPGPESGKNPYGEE